MADVSPGSLLGYGWLLESRLTRGDRMKKIGLLLSTVLLATIGLLAPAGLAAAVEPIYPVMHTSEYPPDGIYFRNSPNWDDAIRVTGHGVFAGDRIRLKCWTSGTNVPRRDGGANYIWYLADNVTRPTSPQGANSGWINAHFVNDRTGPNAVAPGVIQCGLPGPRTIYYSPFELGKYEAPGSPNVRTVPKSEWVSIVTCNPFPAVSVAAPSTVSKLAGWSLGRLGTIYAVSDGATSRRINQILMIDPGSYDNMTGGCDSKLVGKRKPGRILADWLNANPSAQFVILSGDLTANTARPRYGHANAGIQHYYFNDIRTYAPKARSRVLVCNYRVPGTDPNSKASLNSSHYVMYNGSKGFIPNMTNRCPAVSGAKYTGYWHP